MKHYLQGNKIVIAFFLFMAISYSVIAQTGTISGRILDEQNLALPAKTKLLPCPAQQSIRGMPLFLMKPRS
jgi:hypothetical protein